MARSLFAERGFEGTSVEEIAAQAQVSKPVVYEHFGGKEGLYAVVVDREVRTLLESIQGSLTEGRPRELIERATLALLDYVDSNTDGFRILARDSSVGQQHRLVRQHPERRRVPRGGHILAGAFKRQGLDPKTAPMYAQMLVGMVALTGQWWLDAKKPKKPEVAAHLVNLAWNGLSTSTPNRR